MKPSLKTRLRIRFVLFSMLGIFLLLSAIVSVSIWNNYHDMTEKSDMIISQLHNSPNGSIRYFSVKIPSGTETVYPDLVQHVSVTPGEAQELAVKALKSGKEQGYLSGYRYRIYRNDNGVRIYFLSRSASLEMYKTAGINLILVSLVGLLITGGVLIPVSGRVVAPLLENHKKQKEFITAASHELKTPLTVISTNAQLLELEIGKNVWLDGIQKQTGSLTQMTNDLVTLSRAQEYDNPLIRERFSFSDAVGEVVETYEAFAKNKAIEITAVLPDIPSYSGCKAEVQQLTRILMDNAYKYCPEGGRIQIQANRYRSGIRMIIRNTALQLKVSDAQTLTQRFHRGKNTEGVSGFGLGLSIGEAIALRHNGYLRVSTRTTGEFCVEVVLR